MKSLETQLTTYASYHRDRRNIWTHYAGIPLIVFAVLILLSRMVIHADALASFIEVFQIPVTLAIVAYVVAIGYYLLLDLRYGLVMAALIGAMLWFANWFARGSLALWLISGVGLFVIGWALQFVGHFYEGKKPAFVDDLMGLMIGPLFVVAEWSFALHLRAALHQTIDAAVGPTHFRDLGQGQPSTHPAVQSARQ